MGPRIRIRWVTLAATVTLIAAACQRPGSANDTTDSARMPDPASSSTQPTLVGPTWTLVELNGQPAPMGADNRPATLIAESGSPNAGGFAGCNRWSSTYTFTMPDQIRFTAPISTKMACSEGMELEQRFLGTIVAMRTWTMSDSTLVLRGEGDAEAKFVAR